MTARKFNKQTRLQVFQEAVSYDDIYEIIATAVIEAKKGNMHAFDRVIDGYLGKQAEKLEATIETVGPSQEEIALRYAQRLAAKKVEGGHDAPTS